MMSVNKYTINLSTLDTKTGATINIPINMGFQLVDQDELVREVFVKNEVLKNTNTILDYDKVRFQPVEPIASNTINGVSNIRYRIHFLNSSNQYNPDSYYADIGFINPDVKFNKKSFTKSFLRLNFYDTDVTTTQRLLSFITIYPKIDILDYSPSTIPYVNYLKTQFTLGNSILNRNNNGQGFFIYHYKDEVTVDLPKNIYMRAEFNNAKNGSKTGLMSNNDPNIQIDNLIKTTEGTNMVNNLFTKYILKKVNNKYYYEIDLNYSDNIELINDTYVVDLYQITAV